MGQKVERDWGEVGELAVAEARLSVTTLSKELNSQVIYENCPLLT